MQMSENQEYSRDLVNELLTTHPAEPVTSGVVLLLRAELKSEIKSLRREMNQRFDALGFEITGMKSDISNLKSDITTMKSDIAELKSSFQKLNQSLELVAANVVLLLEKR